MNFLIKIYGKIRKNIKKYEKIQASNPLPCMVTNFKKIKQNYAAKV
jgi:hypothetical protein